MYFTAQYIGAVGVYQSTFIPTVSGTFTMNIELRGEEIQGSPFTVKVSTGDLSATKSTTDISTPILIDAGSTYFFTITAKDLYGNRITAGGQSDSLAIVAYFQDATAYDSPIGVPDLTDWEVVNGKDIAGSVEDLGDGKYTAQVTILKAAEFTLGVKINGIDMTGSPFSTLTVEPSEIYAPQCVPVSPPTTASSGTLTTFQVQGRDFYGNNVNSLITSTSSATVSLYLSTSLTTTGTLTDIALNAGAFLVSFTPTLAGTHSLHVKVEGLHVQGSPFEIVITAETSTDLTQTTITSFDSTFAAGDYLKFNIEARDSSGNLRPDSISETFTVFLTDSDSIETPLTAVSNNNGTYSVSYQFTKVTIYTLAVKDGTNSTSIASSPYTNIVVKPGAVKALKSNFVSASNPIDSGVATTYLIEGKDEFDNVVIQDDSDHTFFISLYSSDGTTTIATCTYQFGYYETDVTLNKSGNYDMIIGLIRNGGLRATYFKTVSFYDAIANYATYFHTGQSPTHYTQIDQTVNLDAGQLSVLTGMPAQYYSIRWDGYLKAPHSGKFRFYVESEDYYMINLKLGSENLISLDTTAEGIIESGGDYYVDATLEADTLYSFTLEYVERIGSSEVKLQWESDQINKEIIPKEYLYNKLYSENTPITLVVNPLSSSANYIVIVGDYTQAISGVQETISLESRDENNNLQVHQLDVFTVTLVHTVDSTTVNGVVTPQSNGIYEWTYTLTKVGTYSMIVEVQINGIGTAGEINGSPFEVEVSDSLTDPSLTIMTGDALINAIAGQIMNFKVQLYDVNNNQRTTGGDTVVATLRNVGLTSVGSTWVNDNKDGSYTVQYRHTLKGSYTIEVVVNSDVGNTKSSSINLVAGPADEDFSTLTHPAISIIDSAITFDLVAMDKYGNTITHESKEVAFEVIGNHGLVSGRVPINVLASASYQASYTISAPTDDDASQCGTIGINAYFVTSGLNAEYYSNRWFAGTPAIIQRDDQVNFDFGEDEIIPSVASDYVSIQWKGYLKPLYTENYEFTIISNDGVKVTIGDTVIIDKLDQKIDDGSSLAITSDPISLTANSFVPITVQYYEITGEAFVILYWSSASQVYEVIPSSQFYAPNYKASPVTGSTVSVSSIYSPMKVMNVIQSDSSTYAVNSLTIEWTAPTDYG